MKMDLETLQSQMKVVIQKHQIVVTEMKKDPQNPVLQKQLHDLNSEIMSLSEKQKQIMQHLRNNLQKKQCPITSGSGNHAATVSNTCSQNCSSDVRMVCTAQKPVVNHRLTSPVQTVTISPNQVPGFINSLHQPVPASMNNIVSSSTAAFTFKAPVGTVVLPNCSGATALIANKTVDHQKLHPVLVVPTPSTRSVDGSQTGVLLNIVPPIRVPQYPPPPLQPVPRQSHSTLPPRFQNTSSFVPVCATSTLSSSSTLNETTTTSPHNLPVVSSPCEEKRVISSPSPSSRSPITKSNNHIEKAPVIEIDPQKKAFMMSLGLASRDVLSDLKSKKSERKRRTTANPQFSNAALEEKLQKAAAAAQASGGPPLKRPRGRPRLDPKPAPCTTNGVGSVSEPASAASSNSPSPVTSCSAVPQSPCSSTALSASSPTVMNGLNHQVSPPADDKVNTPVINKKVEQLLSGLCMVCTQPGDLVRCDSCAKQQHPKCMQPPLPSRPEGKWQCSECQSRTDALAAVHSYEVLKTAKEDEKRKLLKKSLELRLKRSQLEGKLYQLKEIVTKQKERQSELHTSLQRIEGSIELLQNVLTHVRQCS